MRDLQIKNYGFWSVLILCFLLSSCAGIAIEGVQATKSEIVISQNIDAARAGDAQAQYKVGEAYCCSIHEGSGLYNTPTSVEWLCKSARQGYSPAMLKLGKIYSGDVIDGIRLQRRILQGISGTSENLPVALTWVQLAKIYGQNETKEISDEIWDNMSDVEKGYAHQLYSLGLNAPCEWNEVITK